MKELIRFEFFKLRKRKSLFVCIAVLFAQLLLSVIATKIIAAGDPVYAEYANINGTTFMVEAASFSSFTLISGIFAILFVCEDYDQQTIKNVIAKGYSRLHYFFAKVLAIWAATTLMFALVTLSSFAIGAVLFEVGDISDKTLAIMAAQYVAALAETASAIFFAFLLRKIGWSVATYIFASSIGSLGLALVDALLDLENFTLIDYWYPMFLSTLSIQPVYSYTITTALIASPLYIAAFLAAGLFMSRKAEL